MTLVPAPEHRYPNIKSKRMLELEAFETAGWGSVPQRLIPKDWKTRQPSGSYTKYKLEEELPERIDNMRETESLWSKRAAARAAGE